MNYFHRVYAGQQEPLRPVDDAQLTRGDRIGRPIINRTRFFIDQRSGKRRLPAFSTPPRMYKLNVTQH